VGDAGDRSGVGDDYGVTVLEAWQLTTDGGEVPAFGDEPTNPSAPLSQRQRQILAHLREHGAITPTEAGLIMHAPGPSGECGRGLPSDGDGCCEYCSSDGSAALKRLARRGIVHRPVVGLWEPIARPA
jgi:hypothetical protein